MAFGFGLSLAHAQNYNSAPEVASTLWAINKAEIETGKLAKNKTNSPAVLQFADQMVTEHQKAQLQELIKQAETALKGAGADDHGLPDQGT